MRFDVTFEHQEEAVTPTAPCSDDVTVYLERGDTFQQSDVMHVRTYNTCKQVAESPAPCLCNVHTYRCAQPYILTPALLCETH